MDGRILQFLEGTIRVESFINDLKQDVALQEEIRQLIPREAIGDPSCPLWKTYSYTALDRVNFDFLAHLLYICRLDGTIADNLNLFGSLKRIVAYQYPSTRFTSLYKDQFDIYLGAIQGCFEGPEVESLIERIVEKALHQNTKQKRIEEAKRLITEYFHVNGRKKPRWIQGGEWPMGRNSPMLFVGARRIKDGKEYCFMDLDTNVRKEIIQYY